MIQFGGMLHWPNTSVLTPTARKNLVRFGATGAAVELDADPHEWSFEMWSWRDEPTIHMTLRNERDDERVIAIDGDGVWEATASEVSPQLNGLGVSGI
jgi:hypothetical protein